MIDLYAAATSNSVRARIALEECGLAHKFHPVDLAKGEHKTPQFLAMNPNAQVPVIVDPEGPGGKRVTLSQSGAILVYCGEKAGKFIPRDAAARPAFWQAIMGTCSDVTPILGSIFAILRSKEAHGPSAEIFKSRWKQYLTVWNTTLGAQKCCVGNEITLADFSLYAGWWRAKAALPPECTQGFPNVERWGAEMAARPATRRATTF